MKHPLLAILSAGALVVLSACSGAGSSVGADSSAGSVDAKQACSAWELGKEQTIDGVRISFEAAAASAVLAAGADPDRWSALAADLAEIYPLATNPSSSTTDRLLELTKRIDASCAGYETWQGAATTPAAAAAAPTSVPAESAQPAPQALTVDDLLLAQITDDQLDYINGEPLKIDDEVNLDALLQAGDEGWGPPAKPWKVTPKECADVMAPLGYISPAAFTALDPKGEASRKVIRDFINSAPGDLLMWTTRAFLSTPEAAQQFVDSVETGLPKCAGGKYNAGGETAPIDEDLRRSGAALIVDSGQGSDVFTVLEPIGSVVYFLMLAADEKAHERGIDVYNELADSLAAAQGVTRDPVTLDR